MSNTILVVDDEPSILRLVQATLESKGHDVVTVDNGMDAIATAKVKKPALILLDIMMPGMDGNEVRARLRKDAATKDIPIVHLSAVGDYHQQLEAFEEGVWDYVTKPFAPDELRTVVAAMLDPSRRDEIRRERMKKSGKARKIVEIMRRAEEHA